MATETWRTHPILSRTESEDVLPQRKDEKWGLPTLNLPYTCDPGNVLHIQKELTAALGKKLHIVLLEQKELRNEKGVLWPLWMHFEILDGDNLLSESTEFFTREALRLLRTDEIDSIQRDAIISCLNTAGNRDTDDLCWLEKGWLSKHVDEMRRVAAVHGVNLGKEVNQVTSSFKGTVIKFEGSREDKVFTKTCHPLLYEPSMSQAVSKVLPKFAPGPFALSPSSDTLLMKSYGRAVSDLPEQARTSLDANIIESVGTVDKTALGHIDALKDAGFPILTLKILMTR